MINFPDKLFVSGTDTGIGKTFVSAMLMTSLNATYWKPIQAGLEEETDTEFVKRVSRVEDYRIIPELYKLKTPMSPHGAADIDGVSISIDDFFLPQYSTEHLLIEGAGGLLVPLNWEMTILDLIAHLKLPVLLVARSSLGTLNHTLLSIQALRNRNIDVFAVILNGEKHPSNKETIEHFGKVPVLEVEPIETVNHYSLIEAYGRLMNKK